MFASVLQGPYWSHIREAWERRDHPNLHWLSYEDMVEDLPKELRRLNHFLGTGLTEDQLSQLAQHGTFSSMQKNPSTNLSIDHKLASKMFTAEKSEFVRKGLLTFSICVTGWIEGEMWKFTLSFKHLQKCTVLTTLKLNDRSCFFLPQVLLGIGSTTSPLRWKPSLRCGRHQEVMWLNRWPLSTTWALLQAFNKQKLKSDILNENAHVGKQGTAQGMHRPTQDSL